MPDGRMDERSPDRPAPDFSRGPLPGIVQDSVTGQVRMLAYVNEDAYRQMRETGLATFFSRSRARLWQKGETSGNVLRVERVLADCDRDALLILARPAGPTCHTGADSCFGDAPSAPHMTLSRLEARIAARDRARPEGSYTARLLSGGPPAVGRKVAEEALESAFAASFESPDRLIDEAADLLFHLLVLLRSRSVAWKDVVARLAERHR